MMRNRHHFSTIFIDNAEWLKYVFQRAKNNKIHAQLGRKLYANAVCKKQLAKESQTKRCASMAIEQEVPGQMI